MTTFHYKLSLMPRRCFSRQLLGRSANNVLGDRPDPSLDEKKTQQRSKDTIEVDDMFRRESTDRWAIKLFIEVELQMWLIPMAYRG